MSSSSNMITANYWATSFNNYEYRFHVINGGLERFDIDTQTWLTTADKISDITGGGGFSGGAEDEAYFYGFNATSNRFYRVNKKTGGSSIQNSSYGWTPNYGGTDTSGSGDGTMLNYDPQGAGIGSIPESIQGQSAGDQRFFHTINEQLHVFEYASGAAKSICSVRIITALPDNVSFTTSQPDVIKHDLSLTEQVTSYATMLWNTAEGSSRVVQLTQTNEDSSLFSVIDLGSGIPKTVPTINLGATGNAFEVNISHTCKITRIDEDHYFIVGTGSSSVKSVIIKVTNGVPAVVNSIVNSPIAMITSIRIRALYNISETESIMFYRAGNTSSSLTYVAKFTHNITTGAISAVTTYLGNKYVGRDFLQISASQILHIYKANNTAIYAEIFDPADDPSTMYNGFDITNAVSNLSTIITLSPKSDDGYCLVFGANGNIGFKLKIPEVGNSLECFDPMELPSDICAAPIEDMKQRYFKLPDGTSVMHCYADSLRKTRPIIL